MNARVSLLIFLIISLAVTPVYATPVYRIHIGEPLNLTKTSTTCFFGGGCYIYSVVPMRITHFYEDNSGYTWFNYTIDSAAWEQIVYSSSFDAEKLYCNEIQYTEDSPHGAVYWFETLGMCRIRVTTGVSFPANISIAYTIPPPAEMVAITVKAYNNSDYTEISTGSIMVTDILGNSSTFSLPAMFSVIKDQTYTYTVYGDATWTFNNTVPGGTTNPFNWIFSAPFTISCFFDSQPEYNWIPVPIIFIFGMVGLACMFVGPIYGINKIKQKEYRQGFICSIRN